MNALELLPALGVTVVIASALAAWGAWAARSSRGPLGTARALAAKGTAVHLIARQVRLPADVVALLAAGARPAGSGKKGPGRAKTAAARPKLPVKRKFARS